MSKLFKYYVLLISVLSATCIAGESTSSSIANKIKRGFASTAGYLFSSGDASEANKQYAENLWEKVDDSKTVQVKKMNKIMEYLFGYKNTFVLPFINQVYINETWIDSLSAEQKRFVIGRALVWLKKAPAYLTAQLGTEAVTYLIEREIPVIFDEICNSESGKKTSALMAELTETLQQHKSDPNYNSMREIYSVSEKCSNFLMMDQCHNIINFIGIFALLWANKLVRNLIKRNIQYDADKNAAELFDCHRGGIETMNNIADYTNDGTLLSKIFGTFPIMFAIANYTENSKIATAIRMFTALPGRLHNSPDKLGSAVKNLPLINLGSSFPQKESRIRALHKLAKNKK